MSEWLSCSASALSQAIHQGKLSSVELMEHTLDRIHAVNPQYNAIVSMRDPDGLLGEARQCDIEIAQGKSRGWLHGIPQAIKDLTATEGIASTRGSPIFADHVPAQDALMVNRIRSSGALIIGKTNTPEFGLGSQTYNRLFGATLNAWDPHRTSGGSSGGAAVALALRMLCVADGSDIGGSLRNPAAWNHVLGFRPSQHLVPKLPGKDLFFAQIGTEGPMARHAIDLMRLLAIQSGHDSKAPLSSRQDPRRFIDLALQGVRGNLNIKGLRIGWLGDLQGYLKVEAGVLDGCLSGLRRLESLGAIVSEPPLHFDPLEIWEAWVRLRSAILSLELEPLYDDAASREQLKPEACWEAEMAKTLNASQLMQASVARSKFFLSWISYFSQFDLLALPAAQVHPFANDEAWPKVINGSRMDSYHRWMETAIYATMSGSPALSLPAAFWDPDRQLVVERHSNEAERTGITEAGSEKDLSQHQPSKPQGAGTLLPIGLQLIAAPQQDELLLGLAHCYEVANQEFMGAKPPILSRR